MTTITISDQQDLSVDLLDFGARVIALNIAGRNVACAYASPEQYLSDSIYLGASIGPITNRVKHGQLAIHDKDFQMPINEGAHTLHSGGFGFDKQLWRVAARSDNSADFVLDYDLTLAGMQGILTTVARYSVIGNTLRVEYLSQCDHATYINLTNHVYLNLGGENRSISDHAFTLFADSYVEVDTDNIPTGKLIALRNPMHYAIDQQGDIGAFDGSVDHHFNVGSTADDQLRTMLKAECANSPVSLEVRGNSPGFQFYTGKFMGTPFASSAGFCVETQYAPDAINQSGFYAPLLEPGQIASQVSEYDFALGSKG